VSPFGPVDPRYPLVHKDPLYPVAPRHLVDLRHLLGLLGLQVQLAQLLLLDLENLVDPLHPLSQGFHLLLAVLLLLVPLEAQQHPLFRPLRRTHSYQECRSHLFPPWRQADLRFQECLVYQRHRELLARLVSLDYQQFRVHQRHQRHQQGLQHPGALQGLQDQQRLEHLEYLVD